MTPLPSVLDKKKEENKKKKKEASSFKYAKTAPSEEDNKDEKEVPAI